MLFKLQFMIRQVVSKQSGELVALALLLPLAIILGLLLWRTPNSAVPHATQNAPAVQEPSFSPITSVSSSPVASVNVIDSQSFDLQIVTPEAEKDYSVALEANQVSVADILLQAQKAGHITLSTQDYGASMGLFVEEINGVRNNPTTQFYWHLYINGQRSALGASAVIVGTDDRIKWSYEKEQAS